MSAKPVLTHLDAVEKINARMKQHPEYRPGMRAVLAPFRTVDGYPRYDIEGGPDAAAIFSWAERQLLLEFDIQPAG